MTFEAKIITDSISPKLARLTTFQITFPRIVLSEFNTHRIFSRNSASSRAIPVKKMIKQVEDNPYVPTHWGRNKPGMQAGDEINNTDGAIRAWRYAAGFAVSAAKDLSENFGVHKQNVNRLLEPFMWHTVIVTATEWSNFFNLRCHKDAHPDIQTIASMMRQLYDAEEPIPLRAMEWHMPYIQPHERGKNPMRFLREISVARCARVSYLTHDGTRDVPADHRLYTRLLNKGHLSPFEHVACPVDGLQGDQTYLQGNFVGWAQYRKMIPNESDILGGRGIADGSD